MPYHDCLSSGFFEHFDRIGPIKQIEEKDIGLLVKHGIAKMVHNGDGDKCNLFGVQGPIRMHSRVYEVYLSPGLPSMIQNKVRIRFWYDEKAQRAVMRIRESEYAALEHFIIPRYKRHEATVGDPDSLSILWGESTEWKHRITGKPAKVSARASVKP